jgi:hypothetical protein
MKDDALPIYFALEVQNKDALLVREVAIIFQLTVQLQKLRITVHDELGMTFQNYCRVDSRS